MELKGKKALVVGAGKTGIATAHFLRDQGAQVTITDCKPRTELGEEVGKIDENRIRVEFGKHQLHSFLEAELIVVSPGVPPIRPLRAAVRNGKEVISEIELAGRFIRTPIIAVTGTDGKTTTATLIERVLTNSGKKVFLGGNIGRPLIDYARTGQDCDYAVAELSSFQLERTYRFSPHIALLLNISQDHLDRYRSFRQYTLAKLRIFANQQDSDFAVLNRDDPLVNRASRRIRANKLYFSLTKPLKKGAYLEDNTIVCQLPSGRKVIYPTGKFKLRGPHNLENIMATVTVAGLCSCSRAKTQEALERFSGLEHRLEFVRELKGVKFFNDSKATTVNSVKRALESFREPIILIAGGRDKGSDYTPLRDLIREKVKALILYGEARAKIAQSLSGLTETLSVENIDRAVPRAWAKSSSGDLVLLSPACSSFDLFSNYEERGKAFKTLVMDLKD
jgi:UDP-N-acetylmuramoylalanine--D-glutamate ligase